MTDASPTTDLLRAELKALIAEAVAEDRQSRSLARFWNVMDVATGVPAVALAASAGVTGLASTTNRVVAGLLALASAVFTAMAGFLQCSQRQRENKRRSRAWRTLVWDGRLAYASVSTETDVRLALERLVERRRALMRDDYSLVFNLQPDDPER